MALSDEVQARYSEQQLVELTNPRNPEATSIASAQLARACTAVEAYFGPFVHEVYDGTVQIHVEVAVAGVIAMLQRWGGSSASVGQIGWDAWRDDCERVRATRARARISPQAGGSRTPTPERPDDDGRLLPPFDSEDFRDFSLRSPAGGHEDD